MNDYDDDYEVHRLAVNKRVTVAILALMLWLGLGLAIGISIGLAFCN